MHPVESSSSCIDKTVSIFVLPLTVDFAQTSDDNLNIAVESEDAIDISITPSVLEFDSFKFGAQDTLAEEYAIYAQNQELAEFLGAKMIAGAAASVATMAAMTLF